MLNPASSLDPSDGVCLCRQTGGMVEALDWKPVLNDCAAVFHLGTLSSVFMMRFTASGSKIVINSPDAASELRGKNNESFRQTIHNRPGSDLSLTVANWNNSTGFKIPNYLASEPGSWALMLAKRIQSLGALKIQSPGPGGPCSTTGLQSPSPTAASTKFSL